MDKDLIRFVAVDFINDENVKGYLYWYVCKFEVSEGDRVTAPLGRHNRLQEAIVKKIKFADEFNAPYPMYGIKYIKTVLKNAEADNV